VGAALRSKSDAKKRVGEQEPGRRRQPQTGSRAEAGRLRPSQAGPKKKFSSPAVGGGDLRRVREAILGVHGKRERTILGKAMSVCASLRRGIPGNSSST
jgi:hypothetical protein